MKYPIVVLISLIIIYSCKKETSHKIYSFDTSIDYPAYGGNLQNNRYSPLDQINAQNVNDLQLSWQYMANDIQDTTGGKPLRIREIQCQPIVVHGVLFGISAELNLFALKADSGSELWKFRPDLRQQPTHVNRGMMYWENGDDQRIYFTAGFYLYAINAKDGSRVISFGDSGRVDLHTGLQDGLTHDVSKLHVVATSPGVIYKNTLIIGSSVSERGDAAPGHIRAFDVITGALKWVFHTIPQPGEYGYDTWPPDAYKKFGGTNNWSGMSLDNKRGVVYFGTGSPSSDYYGGDRAGANLFGNCIMALDAQTGLRKWHYQTIHHDLWDRDFPIPPNLTTIDFNGKKRDIVVQVGKDGYTYVLDRDTGESLFPIEEIKVPTAGLPGEVPYPTQSLPTKPKSLTPQLLTLDNITDISPEANGFIKKRLGDYASINTQFAPPGTKGTILFGYSGGAEWGGNAVDPDGILYQNVNIFPWELWMTDQESRKKEAATLTRGHSLYNANCAACHGENRKGVGTVVPSLIDVATKKNTEQISKIIQLGNNRMPGFPYLNDADRKSIAEYLLNKEPKLKASIKQEPQKIKDTTTKQNPFPYDPKYSIKLWQRLTDQNGYPGIKPPWGTFNAIDLKTGEYKWSIPIGEYTELSKIGVPITGTETYGGPVVTASGLIFLASTKDERLRAIDKANGKVIWEYQLPAGGFATPISYSVNSKQYIALAVGGGRGLKAGGWYMAFSLK